MSLLPDLARRAAARPAVILDDDPTGTQTVRDLFVLTEWDAERIAAHLAREAVFLSTNSRALPEDEAVRVTQEAVEAAVTASGSVGRAISVVSRSDSTLRGHFPAETDAIAAGIGAPDARILLAPFFGEGGRLTVADVHVIERDGERLPVGDTEFARDADFGYRSSNLHAWVAEKYAAAGRPAPPTESLPLELVRSAGARGVADALTRLPPAGVAIANAESDTDIETIALGAMLAESAGIPIVTRAAASYVRARCGQPPSPALSADELRGGGAGLVVVGSHVATTTGQVDALRAAEGSAIAVQELAVDAVLSDDPSVVTGAAAGIDRALADGRCALLMTERIHRKIGLAAGRSVSRALVAVVRAITHRPAWVIAKGGITSYDIARHGMDLSEARIAGALLPGVPVWIGDDRARWPGVPLVVFPGNVGGPGALTAAYRALAGG